MPEQVVLRAGGGVDPLQVEADARRVVPSFAYLQRLPLDQIKIDKLFVQALDSQGYVPLARILVDIGREMRVDVVAEGVETEGQLALLRGFGCRVFQGFLFSKALDKATFLALLAGNAKSLAHPRYGK